MKQLLRFLDSRFSDSHLWISLPPIFRHDGCKSDFPMENAEVRRCGICAGKVRAQWADRPAKVRLETVGWQTSHVVLNDQSEGDENQADAALKIPDV